MAEDWNRYDIYDGKICASYDLLKDAFDSRQGELTKQDVDLALLCAALKGNIEGVKFLLENGADIKAVDGNSDDAVILAARFEYIEVVRLLLQHGGPPNEANIHYCTPLVEACYAENLDLVELLLDHINFKGCSKSVSRRCDEENRDIPMTRRYFSIKYSMETPLIIAVKYENLDLVKMLLDAHIPINESDSSGLTALHYASLRDCPEILDLLLAAKPNVNAIDCMNTTPLLLLLKNGADVTIRQTGMGDHRSVLCAATKFASQKVMEALCEAGADLDYRDNFGKTPLSCAIESQNIDAVRCLIRYGCSLDTPSRIHLVCHAQKDTA